MHELVIIGGGPAGMTAAVYAARKRLDVIMITPDVGGQTAWAVEVDNYLGFEMISGIDLAEKFQEHVSKFGVPILSDKVTSLELQSRTFLVKTEGSKEYESKAVIVAKGDPPVILVFLVKRSSKGGESHTALPVTRLFLGISTWQLWAVETPRLSAAVQLSRIAKQVYVIESPGNYR